MTHTWSRRQTLLGMAAVASSPALPAWAANTTVKNSVAGVAIFYLTNYIASDGGSNAWDASSLWQDDTTWLVASPWG